MKEKKVCVFNLYITRINQVGLRENYLCLRYHYSFYMDDCYPELINISYNRNFTIFRCYNKELIDVLTLDVTKFQNGEIYGLIDYE